MLTMVVISTHKVMLIIRKIKLRVDIRAMVWLATNKPVSKTNTQLKKPTNFQI